MSGQAAQGPTHTPSLAPRPALFSAAEFFSSTDIRHRAGRTWTLFGRLSTRGAQVIIWVRSLCPAAAAVSGYSRDWL